jgi:hypothetical protein
VSRFLHPETLVENPTEEDLELILEKADQIKIF